ncbi:MAG: hypothetical protein WCK34_08900 [Bacteroidota bacterium]
MIDRQKFNSFFSDFSPEVLAEIIDVVFSEYEDRLILIRSFMASRNFPELKKLTHKLVGDNFVDMDPVLKEISDKYDQVAINFREAGLDSIHADFEKQSVLFIEELKAIKKELIF